MEAAIVLIFSCNHLFMAHSKVFLDVTADGESVGRLVFELFDDIVPRTCKNFRLLCTGELGFGFKGCEWYRVIPGFCACVRTFVCQ